MDEQLNSRKSGGNKVCNLCPLLVILFSIANAWEINLEVIVRNNSLNYFS